MLGESGELHLQVGGRGGTGRGGGSGAAHRRSALHARRAHRQPPAPLSAAPRPPRRAQDVTVRGDAPSFWHNFASPFWSKYDDPQFVPEPWDFVRLAPQPGGEQEVGGAWAGGWVGAKGWEGTAGLL